MIPMKDEPCSEKLKSLYSDMKGEWDVREYEMYNNESIVQFHVYVEGLAKTVSKYVGYEVDLKQNKDIRRLKMTITSLH